MDNGVVQDRLFDALVKSTSIDELETILIQKKREAGLISEEAETGPNPMTEKEELKEYYRKRILRMGILHSPIKRVI